MGAVQRIDAFQQRHTWVGQPLAVAYKFFDDEGVYLAALLTYYGFLSLFPLLLLLITALSALLENDPGLQQQVLHSALRQFPVIGDQLQNNIHSFRVNGLALAAGVVGSLYGSLGVAQAAQHALNAIWAVPRHLRPNPIRSRMKGLVFLAMVAVGLGAATGLSIMASATSAFGFNLGDEFRFLATVLAILLNASLLLMTYRILTHREVAFRKLWAVALGGACVWQVLQWAGAYYVRHALRGASATYGMFAIVLGLIAWLYLGALIFVTAAEVSAVRAHRLWPRSLLTPFTDDVQLTPADRRAYTSYATTAAFKGFEEVRAVFHQETGETGEPDTSEDD
ncbi:YihY/virulence factor BrkB family protein [Streptomyces sp. NPDC051320]|uniref:YihY/virulence factor BrkB family protein n=1 Tax=Streptomyces sp. NPDC051320 TaxID=3154644 RepID=UPI00342676CE